jgi:glutathionylspermidine synthase
MSESLRLIPIPQKSYGDYRYNVIFQCFKWDPQVGDSNTIAPEVVVISPQTAAQLARWAEEMAAETVQMDQALLHKPALWKTLGLSRPIQKALGQAGVYRHQDHVRLMRFDFHPTDTGWAVSEVNSDVPGGLAEASALPRLAANYIDDVKPFRDLALSLAESFADRLDKGSRIAFVHATSYADDRQVMEYVGQRFTDLGFESIMAAPDHLRWQGNKAECIARGQEGPVHGLVRFFPSEWLGNLPKASDWMGYYRSPIPACNHPAALLTQSKRLPLVWDKLDTPVDTWRKLLPETAEPRKVDLMDDSWILKPSLGRVGEDITIIEAMSKKRTKEYPLERPDLPQGLGRPAPV